MIARIRALYERSKLNSNERIKISDLEKLIGLPINRPILYQKALRHRSFVAENNLSPTESYEQLEFMGDAVLDLIVSEIIFNKYPAASEGMMTQLRSRLVKGEMLAEIARTIGLNQYIELGDRVKSQGVENSESVLADCFEALVGAIYQDHGYHVCRDYAMKLYEKYVPIEELISSSDNFKSILLETAQARKLPAPVYNIVKETGPGHDKVFDVEVVVSDKVIGTGTGKNKKKAEQAAAEKALHLINKI